MEIVNLRSSLGRWPATLDEVFSESMIVLRESGEEVQKDWIRDFKLLRSTADEANYSMVIFGEQRFMGVRRDEF